MNTTTLLIVTLTVGGALAVVICTSFFWWVLLPGLDREETARIEAETRQLDRNREMRVRLTRIEWELGLTHGRPVGDEAEQHEPTSGGA